MHIRVRTPKVCLMHYPMTSQFAKDRFMKKVCSRRIRPAINHAQVRPSNCIYRSRLCLARIRDRTLYARFSRLTSPPHPLTFRVSRIMAGSDRPRPLVLSQWPSRKLANLNLQPPSCFRQRGMSELFASYDIRPVAYCVDVKFYASLDKPRA